MSIFKNAETEKVFQSWQQIGGGINYNPQDMERFHQFVKVFHQNNECVSKEAFVKAVKQKTHTSRRENHGLAQKFFTRVDVINEFLRWQDNNLE